MHPDFFASHGLSRGSKLPEPELAWGASERSCFQAPAVLTGMHRRYAHPNRPSPHHATSRLAQEQGKLTFANAQRRGSLSRKIRVVYGSTQGLQLCRYWRSTPFAPITLLMAFGVTFALPHRHSTTSQCTIAQTRQQCRADCVLSASAKAQHATTDSGTKT